MADPITLDVRGGRLQTPEDENGERHEIHLITGADSVVYNEQQTVKDKLDEIGNGVVVSETIPDHSCLWIQPVTK